MSGDIVLHVSHDEALVLFELFWRFQETNTLVLTHNAEFAALARISAQLEKTLLDPFASNYRELLTDARNRLAAGMEGLAPGVVGET